MRAAVFGWYGHGNFGDELMLEGLRRLFRGWELIVMSDTDRSVYPVFDADLANRCDLFVLGGGELINRDRLFTGYPWVNKIKIPKVILGCGVNAENPKELRGVVRELEQFSYIGLRDQYAFDLLNGFPSLRGRVHLTYDLACAIDYSGFEYRGAEDLAVVIPTDRQTDKYDKGILQLNTVRASQKWLAQRVGGFGKVVFLPFGQQDNDDFATAKQLCNANDMLYYPGQFNLADVLGLISDAKLTVPYRLHGLVLAFMVGAKYEFYPYHHKLSRVCDTFRGLMPADVQALQRLEFDRLKEAL